MNRREFLIRAAGTTGAAALLAACGDGVISNPNVTRVPTDSIPSGNNKLVITVASFSGLATVNRLVQVSSFITVKRTGTDTFQAFSMACTHEGILVDIVNNGQSFLCPAHGSRFANDGSVINGPNTGGSIAPLQKLPTTYDPATDKLSIG